jgi:hypothetical protein
MRKCCELVKQNKGIKRDTGCGIQDAGCWIQDTGCGIQNRKKPSKKNSIDNIIESIHYFLRMEV